MDIDAIWEREVRYEERALQVQEAALPTTNDLMMFWVAKTPCELRQERDVTGKMLGYFVKSKDRHLSFRKGLSLSGEARICSII